MTEPWSAGPRSPAEQALFDRRIILVTGPIDPERAGHVTASLMALEVTGDGPVELRISAESDSLDVAFSIMDTIDSLGVAVDATLGGTVAGTVVGVLAVCRHRRMGPSGRVHLREPRAELSGVAADLERQAADLESRVERFTRRLAEACRRPLEHVEADLRFGRILDAEAAVQYGLVDEILGPRGR